MAKFDKVAGQALEADPEKVTRNRRFWDSASRTDPDFTKPAGFGSYKFTAIDGYYNILRATELWGAFGQGWGYDLEEEVIVHHGGLGTTAKVKMVLWYVDNGEADQAQRIYRCGPVIATNQLVNKDGRIDDEAFKKATTDALTKSLSYLGFSADVFLGAFDDNRYVDKRREEVKQAQTKVMPPAIAAKLTDVPKAASLKELEALFYSVFGNKERDIKRHEGLADCTPAQVEYVQLVFKRRKEALEPALAE